MTAVCRASVRTTRGRASWACVLRAVCGSTVLYPCDANQTARLVGEMATVNGVSYLRRFGRSLISSRRSRDNAARPRVRCNETSKNSERLKFRRPRP